MTHSGSRLLGGLLAVACAGACQRHTAYDRYDGMAWPSRRPPLSLGDGGAVALLTNSASDSLSVVEMDGPRLAGNVPLGSDPLADDGPAALVIDATRRSVFVTFTFPPPTDLFGPHAAHGASTQPGLLAKLSLDDLRVTAMADTDVIPSSAALTPDGSRVVVSHFDLARALTTPLDAGFAARYSAVRVYDAGTLALEREFRPCVATRGLVLTADGRTAIVACFGSDELAFIALDGAGEPVTRVAVGPDPGTPWAPHYAPDDLVLAPEGAVVYVSDQVAHDVREFDVAQRRFTNRAATLGMQGTQVLRPAFGPGASTLIVPTQAPDALVEIRRDTFTVARTQPLAAADCERPRRVVRISDARYYLLCAGSQRDGRSRPGTLLAFDPATLAPIPGARVTVGAAPQEVAIIGGTQP